MKEILEQIATLETEALAVHALLRRTERTVDRLTQLKRPVPDQTQQYLTHYNAQLDELCIRLRPLYERRDLPRLMSDCTRCLGYVRRRIAKQTKRRTFDPKLLEREQQLSRQLNWLRYLEQEIYAYLLDEVVDELAARDESDASGLAVTAVIDANDDFVSPVDENDPDATRVGFSPFDIRPEHHLSGWGIGLREAIADTLAESLPCRAGNTVSPRAVPINV